MVDVRPGLRVEQAVGVTPGRRRRPASAVRAVPAPRRLDGLGVADSDALLARGDAAVEAVAAVLPTRSALGRPAGLPEPPVDAVALRARHRAQRGIRFAALAAGAADLRAAAAQVRARHRALVEEAGSLWERWSGPSADEVADRVVVLGRAAAEVVGLLEEAAESVEAAGLAVADDVTARADAAVALADPAEPAVTGLPAPSDPAVRAWAADLDARLHRYLDTAERTDRSVAATWRDLADRLGALRRVPGGSSDGPPPDDPDGPDPAALLPPDLLALPEILAALGPLAALPLPDDPAPPEDDVPDGP